MRWLRKVKGMLPLATCWMKTLWPIQGEVVVKGWSDSIVVPSNKDTTVEIELLKTIANGINELIRLNKQVEVELNEN